MDLLDIKMDKIETKPLKDVITNIDLLNMDFETSKTTETNGNVTEDIYNIDFSQNINKNNKDLFNEALKSHQQANYWNCDLVNDNNPNLVDKFDLLDLSQTNPQLDELPIQNIGLGNSNIQNIKFGLNDIDEFALFNTNVMKKD